MQRSDTDDARRLADATHPLLGAEGFNDRVRDRQGRRGRGAVPQLGTRGRGLRSGSRGRILSRMAHEPGGGDDDPAAAEAHGAGRQARIVGEARWPMAGAVLAAMVLTYLLPDDLRVAPMWVLPLIEGLLLVAVVVSDPGEITRRSGLLRGLSIGLVAILVPTPCGRRPCSSMRPSTAAARRTRQVLYCRRAPASGRPTTSIRAAVLGAR